MTEFLEGAVELGEAEVDDALIDEALHLIRILWDAGLAHRDIKPANLMVRDGHILLIDVAFAELRPTPWRQAVDLANMMLCLALRSSAQQVYDRALRQFTVEELSEAFAAARGLALPSQLRRALRAEGRDLQERVPPPAPRATPTHQGAALDLPARRGRARRGRSSSSCSLLNVGPAVRQRRRHPHPGARRRPVRRDGADVAAGPSRAHRRRSCRAWPPLPVGWSFRLLTVNNGRSTITSTTTAPARRRSTSASPARVTSTGATEVAADVPGARRFERRPVDGTDTILTWYEVFPGGCATVRLTSHDPSAGRAWAR